MVVGDVVARIPQASSKTRDITGGLPRVADLFEARKPKEPAILAETSGTVSFRQGDQGQAAPGHHRPQSGALRGADPEVASDQRVRGRETVEKGETIADGEPNPQDILRLRGVETLAAYLVQEIQDVYRLQGVKINDKHIEVIIRQMLRKVEISGIGRHAPAARRADRLLPRQGGQRGAAGREPGRGRLPRSTTCCSASRKPRWVTESFISAASFQETTRVLTDAAVRGCARRPARAQGERHRRAPGAGRYRPRVPQRAQEAPHEARHRRGLRAGCSSRRRRSPSGILPEDPAELPAGLLPASALARHRERRGAGTRAAARAAVPSAA